MGIAINGDDLAAQVQSGGTVAVCIGDEAYYWGSAGVATGQSAIVYDITSKAKLGSYKAGSNGNGALYADSAVTNILASAGINLGKQIPPKFVQKGVEGTSSADAKVNAVGAYNSALNAAHNTLNQGSTITLTATSGTAGSATAADVGVTAADITSAGSAAGHILSGGGMSGEGTFTIGVGIWTDNKGNWTESATIGTQLGMKELQATVTMASAAGTTTSGTATVSVGGQMSALTGTYAGLTGTAIKNLVDEVATAFVNSKMQANPNSVKITGAIGAVPITPGSVNDLAATERETWVGGIVDASKYNSTFQVDDNDGNLGNGYTAESLARAINENTDSAFWAMTETNADGQEMVYVFHKEGGAEQNSILACEVGGRDANSRTALEAIAFENVETGVFNNSGTSMSLGGQKWGTLSPVQTKSNKGHEVWNLTLNGRDVGAERDLWIANLEDMNYRTPGLEQYGIINGMDRDAFVEIQNASNANWKGAEVRTQSAAQEALDALTEAIVKKDKIRADLGALQNRLENTMTNQEIQIENLQASESRISDVDVAKEMTEFTKNNVMTQAAVGMLAQANSMSQLALSLIG